LQEIKCQNEQFPYEPFREAGYGFIEVAGMKGYHGAATVSKLPMERLPTHFCPLDHARHVSTRVIAGDLDKDGQDFEFHNFYIPAGGDIADPAVNDKFKHKLDFIENMRCYFSERFAKGDNQQILVGDFNIAPHENMTRRKKQAATVTKCIWIAASGRSPATTRRLRKCCPYKAGAAESANTESANKACAPK